MERLSRNELFLLAIDLTLPDLVSFCKTSKKINSRLCINEEFWKEKLNKDFPEWHLTRNVESIRNLGSLKNIYIFFHGIVKQNSLGFFPKISEKCNEIVKRIRNILSYDVLTSSKTKKIKIDTSLQEENLYHINDIIFDYILVTLKNISQQKYHLYPEDIEKYAPKNLSDRIEEMLKIVIEKDFWNYLVSDLNKFIYEMYDKYLEYYTEIDFTDNST